MSNRWPEVQILWFDEYHEGILCHQVNWKFRFYGRWIPKFDWKSTVHRYSDSSWSMNRKGASTWKYYVQIPHGRWIRIRSNTAISSCVRFPMVDEYDAAIACIRASVCSDSMVDEYKVLFHAEPLPTSSDSSMAMNTFNFNVGIHVFRGFRFLYGRWILRREGRKQLPGCVQIPLWSMNTLLQKPRQLGKASSDSSMVDEYPGDKKAFHLCSLVQIPLWSMNTLLPGSRSRPGNWFRFLYGRWIPDTQSA